VTTYTFTPVATTTVTVYWHDPSQWSSNSVPDGIAADVVLNRPANTTTYYLLIDSGETYAIRSLSMSGHVLYIEGALSVSGDFQIQNTNYPHPRLDLEGGSLTVGSFENIGNSITANGTIQSTGTINNEGNISGSFTIAAATLLNESVIEGAVGSSITVQSLQNAGGTISGDNGSSINAGSVVNSGTISGGAGATLTTVSMQNTGLLLTSGPVNTPVTYTVHVLGGFSNLLNGVLTGGSYEATYGSTLDLDIGGNITTLAATILLAGQGTEVSTFDASSAGYVPLQSTLRNIASTTGVLAINTTYATSNTLADDGRISLAGTLSTAGLTIGSTGSLDGYGTVNGPVQNSGTIFAKGSGDTLTLSGAVSGGGSFNIASHATLELGSGGAGQIAFADGFGVLTLDMPSSFTGTIVSPLPGDELVLSGIAYGSVTGYNYSGDTNGGTLILQEGTASQSLQFTGSYTTADFSLGSGPQSSSLGISIDPPTIAYFNTMTQTIYNRVITNNNTFILGGAAPASHSVQVFDGGQLVSQVTASATAWSSQLAGVGTGLHEYTASTPGPARTASSVVDVLVIPSPVNLISTTDMSSSDIAGLLANGYALQISRTRSIPETTGGTEAVSLVDGTLSVGPDTSEALLQRFYLGLLGRSYDGPGISYYEQALERGVSPGTIASDFLSSPEYTALHGSQTDTQFLTSTFEGELGRAPSASELSSFGNVLASGTSRADVLVAIANSLEAKGYNQIATQQVFARDPYGTYVHELYETGLGREVDLPSLTADRTALVNGTMTFDQLAQGIATSPEFSSLHEAQTDTQYVSSLYEAGLGRMPDAPGLQFWESGLSSGALTRADVLVGIGTSPEAAGHLTASP